jgi:hypothetical protein
VRIIEELLKKERLRSRKSKLMAVAIRCADRATPLYPLKLTLTSPASGDRSIGIVRWRTMPRSFFNIQCMFIVKMNLRRFLNVNEIK